MKISHMWKNILSDSTYVKDLGQLHSCRDSGWQLSEAERGEWAGTAHGLENLHFASEERPEVKIMLHSGGKPCNTTEKGTHPCRHQH